MTNSRKKTPPPMTDLSTRLNALGLRGLADSVSDVLARATKERLSPTQILEECLRVEDRDRARRSLERRVQCAKNGRFKPIADFDWTWPKVIERDLVERALRLEFLDEAKNLILVGNAGLGKTMIAKNIVHEALAAGNTALYITASQMILDLGSRDSPRTLDRRLKHYARPKLLVIDEIGYLAYDAHAADLLFQVVTLRYERRSTVMTTNLAFVDWPTIFPNAMCVTALVDRLTHHADIVRIEGDSYRKREAELSR